MLSVNYIYNFLNNKQCIISDVDYRKIVDFESSKKTINNDNVSNLIQNNKYHLNLHESFDILLNKTITDFYYDNKFYKNKSSIFTFFNSIFNIGNEFFDFYKELEKEELIKEFIKKIDSDLFEKNLYNKFNYVKNRKFNKTNIQEALKESFQFKSNSNFHLLKEYISDYLGANIYIFHVENKIIDFLKCEKYTPTYYGNDVNKLLPNFLLIYENNMYKAILSHKKKELYDSSILCNTLHKDIIDKIWIYFKIENKSVRDDIVNTEESESSESTETIENNNPFELKKDTDKKYKLYFLRDLKLDNIKKLCIENNISLSKKSDKTLKMINKLKVDLIEDLLKI